MWLKAILVRTALLSFLLLLWWSLSLPLYVDAIAFVLLSLLCILTSTINIVLVAVSLTITVCLVAFTAQCFFSEAHFYREHEKYARDGHYEANVSDTIKMPHGDLAALDPQFPVSLYEQRLIHFKTDSLGYRNMSDYQGQSQILVGDSFIVGNGLSQELALPEVLMRKYQLNTYSIAFPGLPEDYENRARTFLMNQNSSAEFSFFFFEGNDFIAGIDPLLLNTEKIFPPQVSTLLDYYDEIRILALKKVTIITYPRLLYGYSRKLERFYIQRKPSAVIIRTINGIRMGFYVPWALNSLSPTPTITIDYELSVLQRTKCVFFIPDKYRVYRDLFDSQWSTDPPVVNPPPTLKLLKDYYQGYPTKVVDLTPILHTEAIERLAEGKFVFWKDDTHWNSLAIDAVAYAVHQCIASTIASPDAGTQYLHVPN